MDVENLLDSIPADCPRSYPWTFSAPSPKGKTSVQTKGFLGSSCRDASRTLEAALGHRVGEQQTAEFHQAADVQQGQRQVL